MRSLENTCGTLLAFLAALTIAFALPAPGSAEEAAAPPIRPFSDTPCAEDAERMCAQHKYHQGIHNCLRIAKKRGTPGPTSEACTTFLDEKRAAEVAAIQARYEDFLATCAPEIEKYCSDFKDNRQALVGCLTRANDGSAYSPLCNAKRPRRANSGPGGGRFRDGSEPEDYDLQQAMKHRPRVTQQMLAEQARKDAEAKAAAIEKAHLENAGADGAGDAAESKENGSGESTSDEPPAAQ